MLNDQPGYREGAGKGQGDVEQFTALVEPGYQRRAAGNHQPQQQADKGVVPEEIAHLLPGDLRALDRGDIEPDILEHLDEVGQYRHHGDQSVILRCQQAGENNDGDQTQRVSAELSDHYPDAAVE